MFFLIKPESGSATGSSAQDALHSGWIVIVKVNRHSICVWAPERLTSRWGPKVLRTVARNESTHPSNKSTPPRLHEDVMVPRTGLGLV